MPHKPPRRSAPMKKGADGKFIIDPLESEPDLEPKPKPEKGKPYYITVLELKQRMDKKKAYPMKDNGLGQLPEAYLRKITAANGYEMPAGVTSFVGREEYFNYAGYGSYDYYDGEDVRGYDLDKQIMRKELRMLRKYLHSFQKRKRTKNSRY